jgi:Lrp/AsnC family transcriptional regulator, regulator for asnA, asnC and gidA
MHTLELDETDVRILNILLEDAKMPLREIGKRLGISFVTVLNRIKRMEEEKVIKGYSVQIDTKKIGYDTVVIIHVRIAKGKMIEVEKRIASSRQAVSVYDTTGEYDVVIVGKFKSTSQMDSFLKKIQAYEFVERTNTALVLHTMKEGQIAL